uniref:Reverse transcriptase domain-containing protein n=1 Tax=Tanacetum cinerariifolium TaxID=118510 RepID=A0A699HHX3_TANCI|nr:reverse transcriptase domain-containing protein [Tanacetum cinerariifolium]
MADNRIMEELLQAPTKGYGEAIVILEINAVHFEIKINLLQLVQANPYHGFESENPYTHINNFKRITSTLKFRNVLNDVIKLMMFPYSLEGSVRIWENASKMNDRIDKLADQISTLVDIFAKKVVTPAPVKTVEESCVTCGGPHVHYNCDATNSNQLSVCATTGTYNQVAPQNYVSNYMASPGFAQVQNSQNRYNQRQGNNFNLGNNFHGNQPFQVPNQGFQCQPFQVPNNQIQQTFPNEFLSYKKANDQMMRNMQSQINSLKGESKNEIQNTMKTQQTGKMKAITTRSGVAYEGPSIPTNPSPKNVMERETEETTDKEKPNFQGSTAHIQPLVIPISEPDVLKPLPKPNIPYPLRLNDQKLYEKATNQMEKFFQVFQDLHFDISFADALLLMPKFAYTIKILLTNKDKLFELARIPLNENCFAMLLKKLLEKLEDHGKFLIPSDRSITRPKGVAEDVFVKVGKFHFLTNFVVVDFEADPRVPLILGRSFLRNSHALIDIYGEEITLRFNDKAVTFNLNQTTRYSSTYDDLSINQIDIIDVTREEYAQEIHGFSKNSLVGNLTLTSEPIIFDSSPSLTPFEESNFILEEIKAYHKDESISLEIDHADCDPEGDICLIENLLNDDPFQLPSMDLKQGEVVKEKSSIEEPLELELKYLTSHLKYAYLEGNEFYYFLDGFYGYFQIPINPPDQENTTFTYPCGTFAYRRMPFGLGNAPGTFQRCMMTIFHDLIKKTMEVFMDDFSAFGDSFSSRLSHLDTMLQRCEDTNLVLNYEKCHFMVKEGIILGHKISKNRLGIDRAKVNVIAKLPHPMTVKGVRSFLGHAGFYQRFIQDFSKIARPITHLLEKETPFVFSKDCIDAFKTFKKKLTHAPILVVPDWNLPFKLMCDASDFAIGAVVKGMENFAADHLFRLKNPHKDVFENKDINENFPLETLGKISSGSTPWFADFTNFHARNFIGKGMSSQQKKKFFKDVKHYFWDDPYLF